MVRLQLYRVLTPRACCRALRGSSCGDRIQSPEEDPPDHSRPHWACEAAAATLKKEQEMSLLKYFWTKIIHIHKKYFLPMLGGRNVRKFSAAYSSSRHLQLHALAHCKNILAVTKNISYVIRPRLSGNFSSWLSSSLRVTRLARNSRDSGTCWIRKVFLWWCQIVPNFRISLSHPYC